MFASVLPQRIDPVYRGRTMALWLLGLVVLAKLAMGGNSIFNGYAVATSADGIPLDTFPPAAAQAVVSMFAIWGLGQLIFGLLGILALARYRSIVPFMFALLLVEHLGRRLIFVFLPIERTGSPPGSMVNLVLLGLMVVGLVSSLWMRSDLQTRG